MSDDSVNKEVTTKRSNQGKFLPGVSGNPKGRPRGAKNKLTLLRQSLELQLREQVESRMPEVMEKIVELALQGDRHMLKLLADTHLSKGSIDEREAKEKYEINVRADLPPKTTLRRVDEDSVIEGEYTEHEKE
jgi:hypothetical protein